MFFVNPGIASHSPRAREFQLWLSGRARQAPFILSSGLFSFLIQAHTTAAAPNATGRHVALGNGGRRATRAVEQIVKKSGSSR